MKNYYEILRIPRHADQKMIEDSFQKIRNESMACLPPGITADAGWMQHQLPDVFEAYTVLSDTASRKKYDETLAVTNVFSAAAKQNFQQSGKTIVSFNPNNNRRKLSQNIVFAGGLLIIGLTCMLVYLISKAQHIPDVIQHFLRDSGLSENGLDMLIIVLFSLGLLFVLMRFVRNPLARMIPGYRDLQDGFDALLLRHSSGKTERIREVVLYRYGFFGMIWLNLFTESGRRISFYTPMSSAYHLDVSAEELETVCRKAQVRFSTRRFLFVNQFLAMPEKKNSAVMSFHILLALITTAYYFFAVFTGAAAAMAYTAPGSGFDAYASPFLFVPLLGIALVIQVLLQCSNLLNRILLN